MGTGQGKQASEDCQQFLRGLVPSGPNAVNRVKAMLKLMASTEQVKLSVCKAIDGKLVWS